MNSIPDLMNYLFGRQAACCPPDALADIFERLVWCLDDNGAELLQERDKWLLSDEKEKVAVALAMEETFPFSDRAQMASQFQRISQRWPEFAPRCQEILAHWDELFAANQNKKIA